MSTIANLQLKAKINTAIKNHKLSGRNDLLLAQDEIGEIHLFRGKELKIIDTYGYREYIGIIKGNPPSGHIAFIGKWSRDGKRFKNIEKTLARIGLDKFYLNQAGRLIVIKDKTK